MGRSCSNGMTFLGSRDGFFSLKINGMDRISGDHAGPMVKPENRRADKSYLVFKKGKFQIAEAHFGIRSMPMRRRTMTVIQKSATVMRQLAASATQNPQPLRSIHGRMRNIGRVGRTNQNVPSA